jgi:glucose-1-phosphate thymidylyltransferase
LVAVSNLSGLILACAGSEDDDLPRRLQGRSRYALPLANRALVRYAAEALAASGVEDVAVAVSTSTIADVREMIGDGHTFGARFRYLERQDSDTALDTILAARDLLGTERDVLVHSGDALVPDGLDAAVAEFGRSRPDVMMVSERSHAYPAAAMAGARGAGRREEGLEELDHVAPAAIVSGATLRGLDGFSADTDTLGGTVAALAEAGLRVAQRVLEGCWCYVGDCEHLLEGNRMILDELPHRPIEGELETVRIEGRVAIHPNARLERTTVRGPAVIGRGADLIDTFIGPYTSIGHDVSLEGAEIEHSIVLAGASIRHLGQRVEASIIGAGAQVARDYGMPTAVRLQVGRHSSVMLG